MALLKLYGASVDRLVRGKLANLTPITTSKASFALRIELGILKDPVFRDRHLRMRMEEKWRFQELSGSEEQLAKSEACPIQLFAHRERPIYGTPFYPECYNEMKRIRMVSSCCRTFSVRR